jgi:hypothetical protein
MKQHDAVQKRDNGHDAQISKHQNPAISGGPSGF